MTEELKLLWKNGDKVFVRRMKKLEKWAGKVGVVKHADADGTVFVRFSGNDNRLVPFFQEELVPWQTTGEGREQAKAATVVKKLLAMLAGMQDDERLGFLQTLATAFCPQCGKWYGGNERCNHG